MASYKIEVSFSNLIHNLKVVKTLVGKNAFVAPVVKSNAYGHGLREVAMCLGRGVDWFCVNAIEEATEIRKTNFEGQILILGHIPNNQLDLVIKHTATPLLSSLEQAKFLSQLGSNVNIHLKVDTGLHRRGFLQDEFIKVFKNIQSLTNINISGVATHFSWADNYDMSYFDMQFNSFNKIRTEVKKLKKDVIFHCTASSSIMVHPKTHMDLVRPGIMLYGYYTSDTARKILNKKGLYLKPALTFKTQIAQIKDLNTGSYVGYSMRYKTKRKSKIAILPIGYYEGVNINLTNKGYVLVRGKKVPIIGQIAMNMTVVDITDIKGVNKEDEAVLIGSQDEKSIGADEIADLAGTVTHDVLTSLNPFS